jgi:type I restriction enzyme R subunit
MLQQNMTRSDFALRLQQIIDTYNSGGSSTENYYEDLLNFARDMRTEDERHVREGLSEDELELFDLLKQDKMTKEETEKVKLAAKSLLHRLLEEHPRVLVQNWFKDTQTRNVVRSTVEQVLDHELPASYDRVLFRKKCDKTGSHKATWQLHRLAAQQCVPADHQLGSRSTCTTDQSCPSQCCTPSDSGSLTVSCD